jgi:hypothetical protein
MRARLAAQAKATADACASIAESNRGILNSTDAMQYSASIDDDRQQDTNEG